MVLKLTNKKRKCRHCKEYFNIELGIVLNNGFYCCEEHLIKYSIKKSSYNIKKEEHKNKMKKKQALKTRTTLLKESQSAFNEYIRLRDRGQGCISCLTKKENIQYHAGHFKSIGSHPELRFNEDNCHLQCSRCNNILSGNLLEYRENLIKKIGLDRVEKLYEKHELIKYSREEIIEIKNHYKNKIKELKANKE